jgi:site-specific DNA-methyltransferase (adenine-specific)
VAGNVLAYGTGGINIAGCRIGDEGGGGTCPGGEACHCGTNAALGATKHPVRTVEPGSIGRWPAHVVLDEAIAEALDAQHAGASRFFYIAKAPRSEKDQGLEHLPVVDAHEVTGRDAASAGQSHARAGMHGARRNVHPTVKSVALMRWLVRLVTPPGGVVLDLFAGSGTTGVAALAEGMRFVGVEREPTYAEIARGRLAHGLEACGEDVEPAAPRRAPTRSAGPLFDWLQANEVKP